MLRIVVFIIETNNKPYMRDQGRSNTASVVAAGFPPPSPPIMELRFATSRKMTSPIRRDVEGLRLASRSRLAHRLVRCSLQVGLQFARPGTAQRLKDKRVDGKVTPVRRFSDSFGLEHRAAHQNRSPRPRAAQ